MSISYLLVGSLALSLHARLVTYKHLEKEFLLEGTGCQGLFRNLTATPVFRRIYVLDTSMKYHSLDACNMTVSTTDTSIDVSLAVPSSPRPRDES